MREKALTWRRVGVSMALLTTVTSVLTARDGAAQGLAPPTVAAIEKPPVEATLAAHAAIDRAAAEIATRITELPWPPSVERAARTFVIMPGPAADTLARYHVTMVEAKYLEDAFKAFSCPVGGVWRSPSPAQDGRRDGLADFTAVLGSVKGALDAVVGIAQIFQTNSSWTGNSTAPSNRAFVSALAGRLCGSFRVRTPTVAALSDSGQPGLIAQLAATDTARRGTIGCLVVEPGKSRLEVLNARWSALLAELEKIEGDTTLGSRLLVAEEIARAKPNVRLLIVDVQVGGSTTKASSNAILGQRVRFSGGAVVTWFVFESNGQIVGSGLVPAYTGFLRAKELGSLKDRGRQRSERTDYESLLLK